MVQQREATLSSAFPALMRKVYVWMTLALAITGICAYGVAACRFPQPLRCSCSTLHSMV